MKTQNTVDVLDAPADEVAIAQLELERAEEHRAELEAERKQIQVRQGQLTAREAGEFYQLEKRRSEIGTELLFAAEAITLSKLALVEARGIKAQRLLKELQPRFEEQQRKASEEQAKLAAIGEQMYPHQMVLRSLALDKGALVNKLDNQRAERASAMNAASAPVVRNLMRRPQAV